MARSPRSTRPAEGAGAAGRQGALVAVTGPDGLHVFQDQAGATCLLRQQSQLDAGQRVAPHVLTERRGSWARECVQGAGLRMLCRSAPAEGAGAAEHQGVHVHDQGRHGAACGRARWGEAAGAHTAPAVVQREGAGAPQRDVQVVHLQLAAREPQERAGWARGGGQSSRGGRGSVGVPARVQYAGAAAAQPKAQVLRLPCSVKAGI